VRCACRQLSRNHGNPHAWIGAKSTSRIRVVAVSCNYGFTLPIPCGSGGLRIRTFARNNECESPAASIRGEADSIIVGFVQILVAAQLRFAAERKASPGRPSQPGQPRRIETVSVSLKTISVSHCGPDSQVIAL
jgi:hypothetical protein